MKKIWKKTVIFILSMVMFLGQGLNAFAQWNGPFNPVGYLGHNFVVKPSNEIFSVFQLEEGESSILPLESFSQEYQGVLHTYTPVEQKEQADFSSPVPFYTTTEDGRAGYCWLLARPYGSAVDWTETEKQDYIDTAKDILKTRDRLIELLDKVKTLVDDRIVEIGGYSPANYPMIYQLRTYSFWGGFTDGNEVPSYGQGEVLYTVETLQRDMLSVLNRTYSDYPDQLLKADQIRMMLDCVEQFCDYMEADLIAEPDMTSFKLGDYTGIVDGTSHVTLTLPNGANVPSPSEAKVATDGSIFVNWFGGSIENGQLLYRLTPYAQWTKTIYNGMGGYAFDTDLGKTWMVEIVEGDPILQVQNVSVTLEGRTYHARIDEENKRITMTLPVGTDLTALMPVLTHTAASATINGVNEGVVVDLSNAGEVLLTLDSYTKRYSLEVSLGESAECDILSYKIGEYDGIINGDNISLEVPYGTEISNITPVIEVSPDARISQTPTSLTIGKELTYVITAQNGDDRTYKVTIKETPVSYENKILSFGYGSTRGTIDHNQGTVILEVPDGTDVTALRPTIRVSEFASVYPASGTAQDFSGDPVSYVVTSQYGNTRTYRVSVQFVATGPNEYVSTMESLLENIISRYRTQASDDWEWMNLGFYEGITREPSPSNLPEGFNLHARIAKLDSSSGVAMTDLDRTIMMLTALGIDATKLDQYTTEDNPFVDKTGKVITDLVAELYNYQGGYTINGPIFALIALDMGNYTIPDNAVWTREKLLETILSHQYGMDGFGVDMVGMLMQSISPYQNDPVYGERVKAKLSEGLDLFLGNAEAPTVDAMQPDFTFGGFGYQSSESAAQALCALSAVGIDCHIDARFRDGKGNSALTAFLAYADGEYFAHTEDTPKNAMATYQGCYTVQWYLGFLENGGAGNPYSLYYHQQDFSRPLSTEADILAFELEGKQGVIEGNQITVELPIGTPLTNLMPEVTLSDYATLEAPSLPVTFSENVAQPFTIRAEDGQTTKTYYVTVQLVEGLLASGSYLDPESIQLEDANILRELEITKRTVTKEDTVTDILLNVSAGVDATQLYITADISYGATTVPVDVFNGKTKVNLSGWNTIVVTAQDGVSSSTYRIKVEVQESATIEDFVVTIDGIVYRGVIDNTAETIQVLGVPSDADVTALAPEITLSEGTEVCSPLSGVPQNFSSTVNYTVSGTGLATRIYAVDILDAEGEHIVGESNSDSSDDNQSGSSNEPVVSVSAAKIQEFKVLAISGEVDHANRIITVKLPAGTDISLVAPEVTVGNGCSVSPMSGEVVDLRSPIVYTVTNGTESISYTVIVTLEQSISQQLWDEMEKDENNSITDHQVSRE